MTTAQGRLGGGRDASRLTESGQYYTDLTNGERLAILAAALELARRLPVVRYLEVGILGGAIIRFLQDNTSRMQFTGVDLFELFEPSPQNTHMSATFKMADVQAALGNAVRLIMGDSPKELRKLVDAGEMFDLVFLDANHAYGGVKQDFEAVLPLLAPGAWIAFHNCSVSIPPDTKYIVRDGGPWKLTQELRRDARFFLEIEVERVRIFSYNIL